MIKLNIDLYGYISWLIYSSYHSNYVYHNNNGYASEYMGEKFWYVNGLLNRGEDQPAVVCNDGRKEWYVNGIRHRDDGPAIKYKNGTKFWLFNGAKHRLDGPAIEWESGDKPWYVNNKECSTEFEYWIAVQQYINTYNQ